ncbi:hypothetical protein JTE90_026950 [Oedothorax gibbosus]|uniref:Uncharacterized protein n=1 Tax=Oedothorax gibbosus TaxID=931172 RepID=A0AAV6UXA2_9ARAC|nr:hypothetical protein JTE90_026950 [Oedothorax gibbosus]
MTKRLLALLHQSRGEHAVIDGEGCLAVLRLKLVEGPLEGGIGTHQGSDKFIGISCAVGSIWAYQTLLETFQKHPFQSICSHSDLPPISDVNNYPIVRESQTMTIIIRRFAFDYFVPMEVGYWALYRNRGAWASFDERFSLSGCNGWVSLDG